MIRYSYRVAANNAEWALLTVDLPVHQKSVMDGYDANEICVYSDIYFAKDFTSEGLLTMKKLQKKREKCIQKLEKLDALIGIIGEIRYGITGFH